MRLSSKRDERVCPVCVGLPRGTYATTNERQNPYRVEKQFISALETDKTTESEPSGEWVCR